MGFTVKGAALKSGLENITTSGKEFAHQLAVFSLLLGEGFESLVKETMKEVFMTLVERTPIDTGFCMMQWHISSEEPPTEKVDKVKKSWTSLSASAIYEIKSTEFDNFKFSLDNNIYIYNNCIYLEKLEEEAWSNQVSENGWIFLTMNEFQDHLVGKAEKLGLF